MIFFNLLACGAEDPDIIKDMVHVEIEDASFYIDRYEYPNVRGKKPTSHMDLSSAKEACHREGKRLCTAFEWRQACLGEQKYRFGYGSVYTASNCRSNIPLQSGHNSLKDIAASIVGSGQLENCKNEIGIYDMVGNLEEWVLDDFNGRAGSLEGGAWYTYKEYADCTGRYSRQPDFRLTTDRVTDSAGTRCCYRDSPLTEEDLRKDAEANLSLPETQKYQSENEIPLGSGVWIDTYEYPNVSGANPLTGLTWFESVERCQAVDKRLCSTQEWAEACTNFGQTIFPYGNKYQKHICSTGLQAPSKSGAYTDCSNHSGVRDLTGSVWEWVSQSQDTPKLKEGAEEERFELRGGSWFTDQQKSRCEPLSGYPVAAGTARYSDVGFRCCRGKAQPKMVDKTFISSLTCPTGMTAAGNSCIDIYEYPNESGHKPQADVTLSEAQALCRKSGKHLCKSQEWLSACEGPTGRRWPYGEAYDPSICHHNAPDGKGKSQASGKAQNCITNEGIFDLTGNVWEWTMEGKMFGGSWNFSSGMGQCRASAIPQANFSAPEIGFRCCADKEEAKRLIIP